MDAILSNTKTRSYNVKLLGQCLALMLNILLTEKMEAHRVDMSSILPVNNDRRKIPHFLHFDANSQWWPELDPPATPTSVYPCRPPPPPPPPPPTPETFSHCFCGTLTFTWNIHSLCISADILVSGTFKQSPVLPPCEAPWHKLCTLRHGTAVWEPEIHSM